jgi:hypothetical protein
VELDRKLSQRGFRPDQLATVDQLDQGRQPKILKTKE